MSQLRFVAGKGGVGRSVVAAGLAVAGARADLRVLAVDSTADGGLASALAGVEVDAEIEVLELDTEAALEQYIDLYLPLPVSPARLAPLARIFDYVARAAPGVREILTLGKIGYEATEGPWDLVVVDAPATGHVVELLSAADNLGELIEFGPLMSQTAWIGELVADADRTAAVIVSTVEELPVTESLELLVRLERETRVAVGGVVANRVPIRPASSTESNRLMATDGPLAVAVEQIMRRATEAEAGLGRLLAAGSQVCEVPESDDPVDAVAARIDSLL